MYTKINNLRFRFLAPLLFLMVLANLGMGQSEEEQDYRPLKLIEFSYNNNIMLGELSDDLVSSISGFSFSALKQLKNRPNYFMGFGAHLWRISSYSGSYFDPFLGPAFSRSTSVVSSIHFITRYYTNWYKPFFEPFFQANVGIHYLFLRTIDDFDDPTIDTFFDVDGNVGLSASIGAGGQINIASRLALDLSTHFVIGNRIEYFLDEEIVSDIPFENFTEIEASIRYIKIKLGVIIGI